MTAPVTSEAIVNFASLQQATSADILAIGTLAQGSLDNVVDNCLIAGSGYAGMVVTASGGTGVSVAPGYLIQGGEGFSLRDAFAIDLATIIASVPDSAKSAIVLIVADGQASPTSETRTFLDASKKPSNPADPWPTVTFAADTRVVRSASISKVAGTADVQPQAPAYNASLCLLATVVVSNTTILSITQATGQQITRLDQIAPIVAGLSTSLASVQSLFAGLLSNVGALSSSIANLRAQVQAALADLQAQINNLATRTTTPVAAIFRGSDFFTDLSESNPSASGYAALIASGLRFATTSHQDLDFALQAPYSGNVQVVGSKFMMPYTQDVNQTYTSHPTAYSGGNSYPASEMLSFSTLSPYTASLSMRGFSRCRTRAGATLAASSPAQLLANGDPSQIFAIDPTTFIYDPTWGDWQANNPQLTHYAGYWQDIASREYWTPIDAVNFVAGQPVISQPLTPSSTFMLSEARFFLTSGTLAGNMRFMLMGDLNGKPDPTHTYADITVSVPSVDFGSYILHFPMPFPIIQVGGRTYHYVLLSANGGQILQVGPGNYAVGSGSNQNQFKDALAIVNGDWAVVRTGLQVAMSVYRATFGQTQARIPLAPLQLVGGADTIDIAAKLILPEGCTIGYEVYIGGQWVAMDQLETGSHNLLAGGPSNLQINLVLSGTYTVSPIIDNATGSSTTRFSKNGVALDHVSSVQTPSASVTTIHKSVVIDGWNPAVQTLGAKLRTGSGYTTLTSPTSTPVDAIQPDGSLLRQFTWVLGSAVPSFEMELIGTTSDATQTFVARQTSWDATP